MDTVKERLIIEELDTASRIRLLAAFIKHNPKFKELPWKVRWMMRLQFIGMYIYIATLIKRMDYLEITEADKLAYMTEEAAREYLKKQKEIKMNKILNDGRKKPKNSKRNKPVNG